MRLKIVQAGEPVLRQTARSLKEDEIRHPAIQQLVEHMCETMRDAPGVGLAAPQIGLPIQLAVVEDLEEYTKGVAPAALAERERTSVPLSVIFNPQIVYYSEDTQEFFEGCLSVAGFSALVKRSRSVRVEYVDREAQPQTLEASGWHARILQHEIDHLNGRLYIDRMEPRSFATIDNLKRYWSGSSIEEVRKVLGLDR
jgi:peptide deformylase